MVMFTPARSTVFGLAIIIPLLVIGGLAYRSAPRSAPTPVVVAASASLPPDPTPRPAPTETPDPPSTPAPVTLAAAVVKVPAADAAPGSVVAPAAIDAATPLFVVRARKGGPVVRTAPDSHAQELSGLYFDTYLPVLSQRTDSAGTLWYQVRLWGVLPGWIRADQTEPGDPPTPTPRPPAPPSAPAPRPGRSAVFPLSAHGVTSDWVNFRAGSSVDSDQIDLLAPGTVVAVQAWQTDEQASVWYRATVGGRTGWLWSGAVDLTTPNPSRVMVAGKPVWSAIAGDGMWLPVPLLEMADPDAVVQAAHDLGLSHIYLEVGASGGGFYGREGVDRLLPAAHRNGIKVIGWVLTSLDSLPNDVTLCTTIANYRTPDGERLDGIAPDIEDNMNATDVAAFSQILRAQLGTDRLIVGVIFPAGSWIGQQYPVAGILSHSFNALAPMAYWHESREAFTAATVSDYVRHAVVDIHDAVGDPHYPVAVIGQTYDSFSRNGAGPNNPTGQEIATALDSAKRAGAVGVSLFQWGTTTPAEWEALRAFHWTSPA